MTTIKFELKPIQQILKEKGLTEYGDVQKSIDYDVVKFCDDYVPYLTGKLKASPYEFDLGSGLVIYSAVGEDGYNYAEYQYYLITAPENYSNQNGLRGNHWFDRMKVDHIEDIIRNAQKVIDGR